MDVAAAGGGCCCVCVCGRFENEDEDEDEELEEGGIEDVKTFVDVAVFVVGREEVSWAKEELGRIHERSKMVEVNGNAGP